MKEPMIRVLKVEPHKPPEVVTLKNELSALQEAVSVGAAYVGLIEIISLDDDTCILCNEEGKLIGLEPNRRFGYDILCGTFYVTGQNRDGDLASLSKRAIAEYAELFSKKEELSAEDVAKLTFIEVWP